ncbi:MAG TPA: DUF4251 domain-containing protein, partial [Flavisolibacter sp.]|nr:DUF4251 domain-containing protein [Flavisolibacter sp.]
KSMIMKIWIVMLTLIAFVSFHQVQAQDKNSIRQLLESRDFVFKAQSVSPLRGGIRQLTSDYDLRIAGDSMIAYLPYFGRAYAGVILTPGDGPLTFNSTQYTYAITERKKGWDVSITPKDAKDVRQLFLSVTQSGYASLNVTSNNRDNISFNGYITAIKNR